MVVRVWPAVAVGMATMTLLVVAASTGTVAHHASAAFYDDSKRVEITGDVTRFLFRNPHSFLYVDVEDEDGQTVGWEIEMGTRVMMTRRGWSPDTIQVGDRIRAVGQPSRAPGTYGLCCAELTHPDGGRIGPGG
jgi:hypothetical protein